jgi:hypothetical protein
MKEDAETGRRGDAGMSIEGWMQRERIIEVDTP